jgi:hypothetical protein
MDNFNLEAGTELKHGGMELAATRRKESLAAARQHLIDLAMTRSDSEVTADDAAHYIESHELEPLGNAAGSLFHAKHWERTGEYRPSERLTNHAHRNPVYRLRSELL